MDFDLQTCLDLTFFKSTMKNLRKFDDNIIPAINAQTTRCSSIKEACAKFKQEIQDNYDIRDKLLSNCIEKLQAHVEVCPDKQAGYTLDKYKREQKVESIVREASLNVRSNSTSNP
jgi:hypothetical protein